MVTGSLWREAVVDDLAILPTSGTLSDPTRFEEKIVLEKVARLCSRAQVWEELRNTSLK